MKDSYVIRRIWEFAKPYKWNFFISYVVLLIELFFFQLLPLFLKNVINFAVYDTNLQVFLNASLWYSLIFAGYAACGFLQLILWQRLHNKYIYKIRTECFDKVFRTKSNVLNDIHTGDILQAINYDTQEFHHIIQRYAMRFINSAVGIVVSLLIVANIKWQITIIMILIIPVSVLVCKRIESLIKKMSDKIRNKQGEYLSWLLEILKGIREVKLFVAEKNVLGIFFNKNNEIIKDKLRQDKIQFELDQIIDGVYFIADIIFYIVCALFVASKDIDIGQYIAIATYFSMVSWDIKNVLNGNAEYQKRKTCVERVLKLLDEPEELDKGVLDFEGNKACIDIKNLSFAYVNSQFVLKNINLSIKSGEKIGIVGESGVGKSTLANLLLRFYEPSEGEIRINNIPIDNYKHSSIRKAIGIVNQESVIFNSTIRENITLGVIASDQQLWSILKMVNLQKDIQQLPQGLDTLIENSSCLSGGQSQRLCIARLIFRNPPIIILDEATSALDSKNEKDVQFALDALSEGKTTIIISHRYSALTQTDKILVLHNGEQVGFDCLDVLMEQNLNFRNMFVSQQEMNV